MATQSATSATFENEPLDADEKRAHKARTERMSIVPQTDSEGVCVGIYTIHSASGLKYTVDLDRSHGCTCPDTTYNQEPLCKHRRRVAMAVTQTDCPAPDHPLGNYQPRFAPLKRRNQV